MLISLVAIAIAASASDQPVSITTASALRHDIQSRGAQRVVVDLSLAGRFSNVLDRIASGSPHWIELARLLSPGTDASTSESLTISLAEALPKSSAAVLRVLNPHPDSVLSVARVCSAPFIEDTDAHQRAYKLATVRAVSSVRDPGLRATKEACLRRLANVR